MHLVSPDSVGLFHRAILEGAPCTGFALPTRDEAEAQGQAFSSAPSCGNKNDPETTACLRTATVPDILRALPLNAHVIYDEGVAWGPVVDGVTLTDQPVNLLAQGASKHIPLIVGAIADEADVRAAMTELFMPAGADAVLAHNPLTPTPLDASIRIVSDIFASDARQIARLHTAAGGTGASLSLHPALL